MFSKIVKVVFSVILIFSISLSSFSQIDNVYSALLLKPGHVYLSSSQFKINLDKPWSVKSISLEKNTRYAFSLWAEEGERNQINFYLYQQKDSVLACLNSGYETSKGVRYFYFIPEEDGLYYLGVTLHDKKDKNDVYMIQGVYFTDSNSELKQTDKIFVSPFCTD